MSANRYLQRPSRPIYRLEPEVTDEGIWKSFGHDEVFSVEQLEHFASKLARDFNVQQSSDSGHPLLRDLARNRKQLLASYLSLLQVVRNKESVSPAAEWLVDNFHIVEDQILGIKKDLPKHYYSELPKLGSETCHGFPRVYALALAFISRTDSRIDMDTLKRFVAAFQAKQPLKIGEVWAIPITLRIVLVGRLNTLAQRIVQARDRRVKADRFADRLLELAVQPYFKKDELLNLIEEEMKTPNQFNRAFLVQLTQRLRDQDPDVWPALLWIEEKLKENGTNTDEVVQAEHRRQSAEQITVGNIISSMRLLLSVDWRTFFESVSLIDSILLEDPAFAYGRMEFATRDVYRHVIERIAKISKIGELDVARKVVELAVRAVKNDPNDQQKKHVGYYLMGDGQSQLEEEVSYRPIPKERLFRWIKRNPTAFYFTSIGLLTLLFTIPPYRYFIGFGGPIWGPLVLGASFVLLTSEIAINVLNHYITFFARPKLLPKMDLKLGVPETAKTMVVMPTLIAHVNDVKELVERLEVHYLANQDANIFFALLTDFTDADSETLPTDADQIALVEKEIEGLNEQYPSTGEKIFYFFHRKRKWNPSEGKWMGWERKRGKLLEFNQLLRSVETTSYLPHSANKDLLRQIKYVITLDSDTQLPRDAGRRLIGTALHPLNQPVYSADLERVVSGYGILQPRVEVSLPSALSSRFAQIFSGNIGLDPYTTSVSDVYQDLFEEGSFTGKGLYDVDAFDQAVANRGPENAVLSHDLFEGSYARAALVTDVEVFDDYPSDFNIFLKRLHRWTRGDWQIARWIFPTVPDANRNLVLNKLSMISKWKIFDNLRRSLLSPAILIWLSLAWTMLPGSAVVWTLPILLLIGFPIYTPLITGTFLYTRDQSFKQHLKSGWAETKTKLCQIGFMTACLPSIAYTQVDAILRTLYRQTFSKKKLLEWVTFAQVESSRNQAFHSRQFIHAGSIFSLALALIMISFHTKDFAIAIPFMVAWTINPIVVFWLGRRNQGEWKPLRKNEIAAYRLYARRTWLFFEEFVGPKTHWLAPDNFQEDPVPVVALRTSPTNIGLQLLANVSAYDLGFWGLVDFVENCEHIFDSLEKMPKMYGHWFNWYSTVTLEPLNPRYVSTVDSGNLAGHLLTLKQSLVEFRSLKKGHDTQGLTDVLKILLIEVNQIEGVPHLFETVQSALRVSMEGSIERVALKLESASDILNALVNEGRERNEESVFLSVRLWLSQSQKQCASLIRDLTEGSSTPLNSRMDVLIEKCDRLALSMDFSFLFDSQRKLFSIGCNVQEARLDNSYYDLLASESRLASFIAIAKGDVQQEHWFRLGRQLTEVHSHRALIAWTATMFEYLMPILVMRRYENTLLDQTYKTVVNRQIEYGKQNSVPWGISESGYNARDLQLNYQYGPFGIPGLGLKRGLSDELVISPYATFLAAMVSPHAALKNLRYLEKLGMGSKYGFYEAIDFTPDRLQKDKKFSIVKSAMAHHQGMSLVSINNVIHSYVMQTRFHSEPRVKATQLILQEKIPRVVTIARPRAEEVHAEPVNVFSNGSKPRVYTDASASMPRTQLLSNGIYSVMITVGGSGYSKYKEVAVNRWREDWTLDPWGQFFYIRKRNSKKVWSAGYQPTCVSDAPYRADFSEDKVEIWREDGETTTHTEIVVAPEDPVELRRVSISNNSDETVEYDVTSFMELALAKPADDDAHMAFSNLFIQTEYVSATHALLATRRKRSEHEKQLWAFHLVVVEGESVGPVQYETDRSRFIGRGKTAFEANSIWKEGSLSSSVGSVLDPVFSLRKTVKIKSGRTARVMFATGVAESREQAVRLTQKYHDIHIFAREAGFAWTQTQVQLRHLNVVSSQAHDFQRLAARIIYSDSTLRPRSHLLSLNQRTQSALWAYGISGDLPIVVIRIAHEKYISMIREALHAHEYLRLRGLKFDLVILNELGTSYLQTLQEELYRQVRMSGSSAFLDVSGGVFMLRKNQMPSEDVILLHSIARVSLNSENGTLHEQLERRSIDLELPPRLIPTVKGQPYSTLPLAKPELKFFNGIGGFTEDEKTYAIVLEDGHHTPTPWINVIANRLDFGFTVSESGSGYTWSENSRENRLTGWSNDAVSDPPSEAIYIRDEESGACWTPTALPIREPEPYVVKHTQGYSDFEHNSNGIEQRLRVFVPKNDTVKISRLWLKNTGTTKRILSVTSYTEWVLGFKRNATAQNIQTEYDAEAGIFFARNPYNNEFAHRVAFTRMIGKVDTFTGDRKEFLGRNGHSSCPASLLRTGLSGRVGGGFDPCAALQTKFELAPGEEREFTVLLGQCENRDAAKALAQKYTSIAAVDAAFLEVTEAWKKTLGVIQIDTPDPSMNTLVNHWLLYQTLSCRVWGRSAFYQSGGAFGFRDQLQDVMALVYADPKIIREQILIAASRQFKEGDVQHWWHPPTGRGVRTKISDDLVWLPFVTSFYVKVTGDATIWNEMVSLIEAPELGPNQEDLYLLPDTSIEKVSIFEHCARAIERSLKVGKNGLPLMGGGDWNDGMNRVGTLGQGESVWLGWFLSAALDEFVPWCETLGAKERATIFKSRRTELKKSLEGNAWDGEWYRRAYFDDGTPLGSKVNDECKIDSISQSWAVISGLADPERAIQAMNSADEHLVLRSAGLIKLFQPPFDKSPMDPGYIKGYVPGVRENGGQYTHAAIWAVMAFAKLGDPKRAHELFSILNPINHSMTRAGLHQYKVEPYVMAADVYGMEPHVGRGGWTWYTGSSSLMYRAALEYLLGFQLVGDQLKIQPCIPASWPKFEIRYFYASTPYKIVVTNRGDLKVGNSEIRLDGALISGQVISLVDDQKKHLVEVYL